MPFASILRRLLWLAVLQSATTLCAQHFDLGSGREPLVSLDGLWRFHPGDSPQIPGSRTMLWAAPDLDDSGWPLLEGGRPWSEQGYPRLSGFGWYRFTVKIPPGTEPTSMLLAPICTSFEVYVDGRFVGGSGDMPPTEIPSTHIRYEMFPLTALGSASPRTVTVAIRVWHSPIWSNFVGGGPLRNGHLAGDPRLLASEQRHEQLARNTRFVDSYSYSIAAALIGFAILGLFLIRPAEREYLWFAVILLAQAADNVLYVSEQIYSWPAVPLNDLIDGTLMAIDIVASQRFFSRVLEVRSGRWARLFLPLAAVSPLACVLYWPGLASVPVSATVQLVCLLPAILWIFWALGRCALQGNQDARLLLLPALLDLGYYLADNMFIVLNQAGWMHTQRALEVPLPLPPFTMQIGVFFHLFFLLAMLVFLIRRFTLARRREERLASEFEAARQVQKVLLPEFNDRCSRFAVECIYHPADQVSGDFFQEIGDGDGGLLIVVGDVSGKGLPAAMTVSMLVGAIRAEAAHASDPAAMLASLNERALGRAKGGFTTCLAAHLSADGSMTLANAGHLPPYLNGRELDLPGSLPLGIVPGSQYEVFRMELAAGDRLTFISDGVVEAQTRSGELFGFDRARDLSRAPATTIAEAARKFGQCDDITVVTVEFSAVPAPLAEAAS